MTLLVLMFSTDEAPASRTGFFGAVQFSTEDVGGGVTGSTMGVGDPTALVVVFAVVAAFLTLTQLAFVVLKHYRAQLIAQGVGPR